MIEKHTKKEEKKVEWLERIVQIRRVTKVVKGGKKLSFRAIVVIGNDKGSVGVGVGKAGDVIGAVKKAVSDGKKTFNFNPIDKKSIYPTFNLWAFGCCKSSYTTICFRFWCNCR